MKSIVTRLLIFIATSFIALLFKVYFYDNYIFYNVSINEYNLKGIGVFDKKLISKYKDSILNDGQMEYLIYRKAISSISKITITIENEYTTDEEKMFFRFSPRFSSETSFLGGDCRDCEVNFKNDFLEISVNNIKPNSRIIYSFYFKNLPYLDFRDLEDHSILNIYSNDGKIIKKSNGFLGAVDLSF